MELHNTLNSWLFEDTPILASLIDSRGRFVRTSKSFADKLGYEPRELEGLGPAEIATPESREVILTTYRPLLTRTGKLDALPVNFLTRSGKREAFFVSSLLLREPYQHSVSIYVEASESDGLLHRFGDAWQVTPALLHKLDANDKIVRVSDRWLDKLGYRREQVLGRDIKRFFSPATRQRLESGELEHVGKHDDFSNYAREFVTHDGRIIEVVMSGSTERDDKGNVLHRYVASKDVTARNRTERELRRVIAENQQLRERLEHERDYLREEVDVAMNFGQIVGSSPAIGQLLERIDAVAATPASVLLVGESGTGKELAAHAIHGRSDRSTKPLVKVNCASIPEELFESEFFGHVKGAFTGAYKDRVGRFALADGGTIFLDEIGEIPLALQSKLLRVLQEREFERVGEDITRTVNVRVIAATNRDLRAEVAAGRFREDLYYRLSVFPVEVPPLRERGNDVLQLATHLLEQIARDLGRDPIPLTQVQAEQLRQYHWPGNVRELRNTLERAVILARDGVLDLNLPTSSEPSATTEALSQGKNSESILTAGQMRQLERRNLVAALKACNWRVSGEHGAARLLDMNPSTLNSRIRSLNIERPGATRGRPAASA